MIYELFLNDEDDIERCEGSLFQSELLH